jgi:NDP-sugar pyrophosphorylase family protein
MSPLTATVPKGLIPVVGVPFLDLQLRQLAAVGIEEFLLAVGTHQLDVWEAFAADREGVRLIVEEEPLDTAGPVRLALDQLDERFMVLNGDVIIEADLGGYLARVPEAAEATLALVEVEDTSAYGVVVLDDRGMVEAFVEKPKPEDAPARTVNAGMYVMDRSAIEGYPDGRLSFERVVFPELASRDALGGVVIDGRWMDIGTPELYLETTGAVLNGETTLHTPAGPHLVEGDLVGTVEGEWSWIAPGATVAAGATVSEAVILSGAVVESGAEVRRAVIGWDATIGEGAVVTGSAMIGRGATIGAGSELDHGIRIAPGAVLRPGDVTFAPPK